MENLISGSMGWLDRNLGRCPRCMKVAFACAAASWVALFASQALLPGTMAVAIAYVATVSLTALWVLHFTVYTARTLMMLWSEYIGDGARPQSNIHDFSRRDLLWVCGNALSIGVLASVWLPASAFAAGRPCGSGHCPDSAPNCCSRSQGKCCNGNWACTKSGTCHSKHSDARAKCGKNGTVWACS